MYEELREDMNRVWDECFKFNGHICFMEIQDEPIPLETVKQFYEQITDALFLLGIKIQPWEFDEDDLKYIEKVKQRVKDAEK